MKSPDKHIIDKTLKNTVKPEETKEVVRWFSTSEGQSFLSDLIDKDEHAIPLNDEHKYVDHTIPSKAMYEHIMNHIHKQARRRFLFRAAAFLIPFLFIAALYVELNSRVDLFATAEYDEIYVPHGEQVHFVFQDGSHVYLNSGSRLRYPRKFALTERKVELDGQGYFDIGKNKNRPFIIDLNSLKIKVLGTSFDTKAYLDENIISISLENGSVELQSSRFKTFNIQPGEQVIYNRETGHYQIIRPQEIANSSAWKDKKLIFTDIPLDHVLTTLSRTFDTTFNITDQAVLKYSITLATDKKELEFILNELEKIAPITFEKNENRIKVKMKKEK